MANPTDDRIKFPHRRCSPAESTLTGKYHRSAIIGGLCLINQLISLFRISFFSFLRARFHANLEPHPYRNVKTRTPPGKPSSEQTIKGERYRLNIVVVELDKTTSVEYQIALLAFINCVIISAATLQDRIRMRNEFIGEYLIYSTYVYTAVQKFGVIP